MISKIEAGTKEDIQKFWKSLYHSLYDNVETALSSEMLFKALDDLEDMFRYRDHLAVIEMPLKELAGKRVLEIGTGAGGHSALFAKHGAVVTGVDLTPDRVQATSRKFSLMGDRASGCIALQADAENLPFADGSFDIVYSNGVLHHTVDTNKALDEAYRVLKPGGRLVMMLYCKDSWHYWVNMWLCVGLLQGKALRDANWLGRATEWGGKDRQSVGNPYTRCYSRQEMQGLMGRYGDVTLRKGDFFFYLIPKLGRLYRRWQVKRYGEHPGGVLVYGVPWPIQSPLELRLGKLMGFSWWTSGIKPE